MDALEFLRDLLGPIPYGKTNHDPNKKKGIVLAAVDQQQQYSSPVSSCPSVVENEL